MLDECSFRTDRLTVSGWYNNGLSDIERAEIVIDHITPESTKWLPQHWQHIRSVAETMVWIDELEQSGATVLVAEDISTAKVVGMLMAAELEDSITGPVHIGYLVSPSHQGRGYATEIVIGFLDWAQSETRINSVLAGADRSHNASRAVLKKAGFKLLSESRPGKNDVSYEFRIARKFKNPGV